MKHNFKSIKGAVRRVRELEKINARQNALLNQFHHERIQLAKLAADKPQFDNPLIIMEVVKLRDSLLSKLNPNPNPAKSLRSG